MSCYIQKDYISNITNKIFQNKYSIKPVAVISYGPTGSGKSKVLDTYLHYHAKTNNTLYNKDNFVDINIDYLVDNLEDFKKSPELYFTCRTQVDELSSLIFAKAISEKMNINYETTGNSIIWLTGDIKKLRESGYIIVVVYPFVKWSILNKRLDQREKTSKRKIDRKFLYSNIKNAMNNFSKILSIVDYAYIYDNNETDKYMRPIFEYNSKENHEKREFSYKCSSDLLDVSSEEELSEEIVKFFKELCFEK